jgi:hypothetical protein
VVSILCLNLVTMKFHLHACFMNDFLPHDISFYLLDPFEWVGIQAGSSSFSFPNCVCHKEFWKLQSLEPCLHITRDLFCSSHTLIQQLNYVRMISPCKL